MGRLRLGEKIGYVGLGCYQVWEFVVVMGLGVVDSQDAGVFNLTQVRMLLSGLGAAALIVAMFVEHSLDMLGRGRWLVCLAGCATSMGTLLFCQSFSPYQNWSLCVFGIVLVSVGNALLVLAWIDHLSSLSGTSQLRCILVTWLVAGVLSSAVSLGPLWVRQAAAAGMPLMCAVSFMLATERSGCSKEPESLPLLLDGRTWYGSLTRVLIACLCVSFALGASRALPRLTAVMRDPLIYLFVALCVAALMVLPKITTDKTPVAVAVYRLCLPVMTVSYLVLPFVPPSLFGPVVTALLSSSFLFEMLMWLVCPLVVIVRGDRGGLYLFGWGVAAIHVGSLLGLVVGDGLAAILDDAARLQATCLVSACALILVMSYVLREQGIVDLLGAPEPSVPADAGEKVPGVVDTCDELSREFGLSSREGQILVFLAQGRSIPYIADTLGISISTAKTHTRHIYQKIGVHTKQELLDLFL